MLKTTAHTPKLRLALLVVGRAPRSGGLLGHERNDLLTLAMMWVSLGDTILSEEPHTQGHMRVTPCTGTVQKGRIQRQEAG